MKKLLAALSAFLFACSSVSVALAGDVIAPPPGFQIYPDTYFQTRRVESFFSASRLTMGTSATIIARVYGESTQKPITGERLRLQIDGGDASVGIAAAGRYSSANTADSVYMDHICYNKLGSNIVSGNILLRNGSDFASVAIANYGEACPLDYVESGWYMAKIFAPSIVERDQSEYLRITDLSDPNTIRASDTRTTIVTRAISGELSQINVIPLVQEISTNKDVPVIVFAQDRRGFGLSCSTGKTSGESSNDSGCNVDRNGYYINPEQGIDINQSFTGTSHAGSIAVAQDFTSNAKLYSRGSSTTSVHDQWALNSLGGGAYLTIMRAGSHVDRGEIRIDALDSSNVFITSILVRINVLATLFTAFRLY